MVSSTGSPTWAESFSRFAVSAKVGTSKHTTKNRPRTGGVPLPATKSPDRVVHLTVEERAAAGKGARVKAALEAHGEWAPEPDRPDPIALLEEQAKSRVPELVPIRHGRMEASPFSFYRGAAYILAADLGPGPTSGLHVQ